MGKIYNEFGELVGKFYFMKSTNNYALVLYGIKRYGYTLEGIYNKCLELELYAEGE